MVETMGELRKICRKGEGPDSFEMWRKLALYITRLLLHTNVTANQITMLSAIIGIIAGIFMANGNQLHMFVSALLFYVHFIFDLVDGQIARYRKSSSLTGAYIERLVHYIVNPFVFISIAFGLYSIFQDVWVFVFGFLAALSQILIALAREMKFIVIARALLGYKGYVTKPPKDCGAKAIKDEKYKGDWVRDGEESQLISSSSAIYTISRYGYRMVTQPYRLHLMLLAAIIDLTVPSFSFFSFTFNAMYTFLFIYAIFSPVIWFGWILLAVKTKSPDRLFSSLS